MANSETKEPTPGPWRAEHWSGGEGHAPGWYVARSRPDWNSNATEWMKDSKRRIAHFNTESEARAAIRNATGQ